MNPTRTPRHPGDEPTRLDVEQLEDSVRKYFKLGLAPSTQHTYKSGKERYLKFCQLAGALPLPVCESKGVEDSVIKTLGRWESVAYLQYVRIPRERLTAYSQHLVE